MFEKIIEIFVEGLITIAMGTSLVSLFYIVLNGYTLF